MDAISSVIENSYLILSIAISNDQKILVSGSNDKTIRVWDFEEKRCIRVLKGHEGRVMSVAITPDNNYILSGSDDKSVRIWELNSGRNLLNIEREWEFFSVESSYLRIVAGDFQGNILFFSMKNFPNALPVLTATQIERKIV